MLANRRLAMSFDVLSARDLMSTDFVTTSPDASVSAMFRMVIDHPSQSALIVDGDRRLLGVVTEGDLLWTVLLADPLGGALLIEILKNRDAMRVCLERMGKTRSGRAQDVMSSPVVTVDSDDPLSVALVRMALKGFRQIPVVDNGRLQGTLYRSQVLKSIASIAPN